MFTLPPKKYEEGYIIAFNKLYGKCYDCYFNKLIVLQMT